MGLLAQFDPPAFMSDFDDIPGGRDAWHNFISACFTSSIASEKQVLSAAGGGQPQTVQFFDPTVYDPGGPLVVQAVTWNAFPKELLVRFGRDRALIVADRVWPRAAYGDASYDPMKPGQAALDLKSPAFFRPQDEYCEWHVDRDPVTGRIRRITFTSEPPEYWQALFGSTVQVGNGNLTFPGNRDRLLQLYHELVSPEVKLEDLIAKTSFFEVNAGDYNPYNKWNSTHGIVHLAAPPNYVSAEIQLGADATVLYRNSHGDTVVQADALICCASFGGPDRNSDPTIGSTVNALARAGAMVTLVNPVGLYMDHIDLAGWEVPGGIAAADCVRVVRGRPGMIERLVVEVPPDSGYVVGDITIGGVPIVYGGQVAECITVKLVGGAAQLGSVKNKPVACKGRCCVDPSYTSGLGRGVSVSDATPVGTIDAFAIEGGYSEDSRASVPRAQVRPTAALFATRRTR